MSQENVPSPQGDPQADQELPKESITELIELGKQRAKNEAASLSFREKELAANLELAKISLGHQADYLKSKPREGRKSFALVVGGISLVLIIVLGFLGWCMSMGKEQFVIEFLKYALYPVSAGGGYWVGRKSTKKDDSKNAPATELVEDANVTEDIN